MPPAPTVSFTDYLSHADPGVRGRAWAWQSAVGLQLVEGRQPSAYLLETACRHIEGGIALEMVGKLADVYYLTQPGATTEAADRKTLEMVRMLGAPHEGSAPSAPAPEAPPPPPASPPPPGEPTAAPESAAALHLRQKRLLRTLGTQALSVPELLKALNLNTRQSFMRVWVSPAMEMGLVKPLHPDSPRHPQQKYLLTRKGQRFLKQLIRKG